MAFLETVYCVTLESMDCILRGREMAVRDAGRGNGRALIRIPIPDTDNDVTLIEFEF